LNKHATNGGEELVVCVVVFVGGAGDGVDDGVEAGDDGVEAGDDGVEAGDDGVEAGDDGDEAGDDGVETGDDGGGHVYTIVFPVPQDPPVCIQEPSEQ